MLKVDIRNDKRTVVANGSVYDFCNGIGYTVATIYQRAKAGSPEIAKAFKAGMQAMILDEDSPVWTFSPPPGETDLFIVNSIKEDKPDE